MEFVGIARVLWRRRIAVGVGVLAALAAAVLATYQVSVLPPDLRANQAPSRSALARVLIDTPDSLVAGVRAKGSGSIVTRASLLGGLLASDHASRIIAAKMGLRPAALAVSGPDAAAPVVATPLAEQAVGVTQPLQPYVVSVEVDPTMPIVSFSATAPDPRGAVKLANAATTALFSVARTATAGAGEVRIERLGKPQIGTESVGPAEVKAIAGAIAFLVFWCSTVVVLDGFIRRRRRFSTWANGHRARA
jgi:hypothetical protein